LFYESEIIRIGQEFCGTPGYVRPYGMVHADVTPGNNMLTKTGEMLVPDFGLVYAMFELRKCAAMSTSFYLAPEQRSGQALDHRVDIVGPYQRYSVRKHMGIGTRS